VPLRTRWREDRVIVVSVIAAALLWVAALVTALIFAMAEAPQHKAAPAPPPAPAKTRR
jgi:hypothetical protein